jgi:pimeloyl-ACP methyl ester carboxylesterase
MKLTLRDGRVLGFDEYGDPSGVPVYFFHGLPSCRLEASASSEAAQHAGVRLIAVDRPGLGLSSFRSYRPLARFAEDVAQLADDRGTDRFAVVGVSAGGPFALATAATLPGRVSAVATVAGFANSNERSSIAGMNRELRASLLIARRAPWMCRPLFALTALTVRWRGMQFVRALARRSAAPDRELLRSDAVRSQLLSVFSGAFARGARGAAWEQRLLVRDWGFSLKSARIPVTVWQGTLDRNVPPEMGRALASSIAAAHLRLVEDEGHLSLVHNRFEEVLRDLTSYD